MAERCSDTTWRGRQGVPEPRAAQLRAEGGGARRSGRRLRRRRTVAPSGQNRSAALGTAWRPRHRQVAHTLRVVREELFDQVLGWQQGVQYQVVAFQAVMADQLAGETIHHAVGLNKHGEETGVSLQRMAELLAGATRWRWLLVDEISMVSAELLARLELRCRELVRDACKEKYGPNSNAARPFGGLNVKQSGGNVAARASAWYIPGSHSSGDAAQTWAENQAAARRVRAEACVGGTDGRRSGSYRIGALRAHARCVAKGSPGSVSSRSPHCGHTCVLAWQSDGSARQLARELWTSDVLATDQVAPERILEEECKVCKSERRSKALGAATPQDPRLQNELKDATCIFATNAVKYHVNRTRAREFAAKARQQIYYSIAEDLASAAVLAEKPHLEEDKVKWLQRHDRESGNLYGTLPLCIGMPVSATDHLDRERRVLRGCAGTVRGWTHTGDKSEVTRADGHVRYWAECQRPCT